MDLETENRIATMLLKEAAELRRQAEKEGVEVYLREPKSRGRPNSRFLTATVIGVQQANRTVEENEMWRARQKELELDNRRRRTRYEDDGPNRHKDTKDFGRTSKRMHDVEVDMQPSCSSRKRVNEGCDVREGGGLRDDEVDEFLHSRMKRGRGSVGSRMDETGPYLPSSSSAHEKQSVPLVSQREWQEKRVILGPEKPSSLGLCEYSEDEHFQEKQKAKKVSSSKERLQKHKSKDKMKDKDRKKKKRAREEKKSKHHK